MAKIERFEIMMVDLKPKVRRSDAIQSLRCLAAAQLDHALLIAADQPEDFGPIADAAARASLSGGLVRYCVCHKHTRDSKCLR